MNYLCVMLGGGVGSLTRYLIGRAMVQQQPGHFFAWSTFLINVTGSFLIGLVMRLLVERLRVPHFWQLLLVTGFLGGYTTFSSFEYETYLASRGGHHLIAFCYVGSSIVLGYGAVWLGSALAGKH